MKNPQKSIGAAVGYFTFCPLGQYVQYTLPSADVIKHITNRWRHQTVVKRVSKVGKKTVKVYSTQLSPQSPACSFIMSVILEWPAKMLYIFQELYASRALTNSIMSLMQHQNSRSNATNDK